VAITTGWSRNWSNSAGIWEAEPHLAPAQTGTGSEQRDGQLVGVAPALVRVDGCFCEPPHLPAEQAFRNRLSAGACGDRNFGAEPPDFGCLGRAPRRSASHFDQQIEQGAIVLHDFFGVGGGGTLRKQEALIVSLLQQAEQLAVGV